MSVVNPLAGLSDDELVADHCRQGANSHPLSEMMRRLNAVIKEQNESSIVLAKRIANLNVWLLWVTVAIGALTLVQAVLTGVQLYVAAKGRS